MVRIPLREGRTLHHDIIGIHGSSRVVMRSAPSGTGIIAGGSVRAVFELLGIQDIVAKSVGSSNPYNIIRAAVDGLKQQKSPKIIAARRSKKSRQHYFCKRNDMTQKLKITLKKSTIGSQKGQIATVKGLGLKKINSSVIREATPETLGMIKKIKHLVITENN